jgi:DNA invertase Pin-like site-specific DNA recombinase
MPKSKNVALYARVSTDGQTCENQLRELRAAIARHGWTIVAEYVDRGVSGFKGRKDRPRFDALLNAVTRKEFDMVAAWSVDRLGRSLQDLVGFLGDLQAKKVDLYLHQQALDTSTPSGKAMFGMLGVFAEFERTIIQERVKAGLARARAKGTTLGRPRTALKVEQRIRNLAAKGVGKVKIARTLGIGVSVTQRVLHASP